MTQDLDTWTLTSFAAQAVYFQYDVRKDTIGIIDLTEAKEQRCGSKTVVQIPQCVLLGRLRQEDAVSLRIMYVLV